VEAVKKPGSKKYNEMTNEFFHKYFSNANVFLQEAGISGALANPDQGVQQNVVNAIANAMYQGGNGIQPDKKSATYQYTSLLREARGLPKKERALLVDKFKDNPLYAKSQPDRQRMYIDAIMSI